MKKEGKKKTTARLCSGKLILSNYFSLIASEFLSTLTVNEINYKPVEIFNKKKIIKIFLKLFHNFVNRAKINILYFLYCFFYFLSEERNVLTLGSLCLPCCVRDTGWSWFILIYLFRMGIEPTTTIFTFTRLCLRHAVLQLNVQLNLNRYFFNIKGWKVKKKKNKKKNSYKIRRFILISRTFLSI